MKKYLNNNLFYQGDSNILGILFTLYIGAFIALNIQVASWFDDLPRVVLYSYYVGTIYNIVSGSLVLIFITYIIIAYMIVVGIFKRKKWSTLLSGPFTRQDIRRRELIIMMISVIVFIGIYLIFSLKGYFENKEIISYMENFSFIIISDVIRMIAISIIGIGGLFLIDSIFSNLYFVIFGVVFTFVYLFGLIYNFNFLIYYNPWNRVFINNTINILMDFIFGNSNFGSYIYNYRYDVNWMISVIVIAAIFILIGGLLIFGALSITNKMKVENMNEGIIFEGPKKVARFMGITILGLLINPVIINTIDKNFFLVFSQLGELKLFIIKLFIIIVLSYIFHTILKKYEEKKKKCRLVI